MLEKIIPYDSTLSAAYVKIEIPVLIGSQKSSILSSTSFQMGKTFWGVVSTAVEQSKRNANMVSQEDGKFGPLEAGPRIAPNKKKRKEREKHLLQLLSINFNE